MALRLWLPLDGTTANRGISGTAMSGSPSSWGYGRTGNAAVFSNNASNRIYASSTYYNYTVEDFSWCMWVKKDFSSITAWTMYAFTVGRADAGGYGYGLRSHSSTTAEVRFGSKGYTVNGVNDNEWHHIAFTRRGTEICIYLDGVLNGTYTFDGTLPTYSDGAGLGIGCFHYASGDIYPLIGAVSDFRIYDHALSAKEVHEISKALILYYKLSGPTVNALPNLITWNTSSWVATNKYAHTSSAADGYITHTGTLTTVAAGKTYYIQVKSSGIPGTHSGGTVTNNFTLFLYLRNIGTSKSVGGYDAAINLHKNNIYVNDQVNGIYVWKWTAPSNAQDIVIRTNSYSNGSTSVTIYFWDLKIEEGAYTPYVPSVNMPQYSALGYNSLSVSDESGWGHTGTRSSAAPGYVSGSPRNSAAWDFIGTGGTQYLFPVPDPITSNTEEFSVSIWFNTDTPNTTYNQCIWNGRNSGGSAFCIFIVSGMKLRIDDSNATTIDSPTISNNTWYHLVVTWKSGGKKIAYLNGTKVMDVSAGTLTKSNTYASIGRTSNGDTLAAQNYYYGMLSDFRIYGTALNADDVLRLYRSGTSFDNLGGIHSCSLDETRGKATLLANGTAGSNTLSERGGNGCAYNNTNKYHVVDTSSWSYTPTGSTNNSCLSGFYFESIPGVLRYRIELTVSWSGFADISTSQSNFNAFFQGVQVKKSDGSSVWEGANYATTALNSFARLDTLAKNSASGVKRFDCEFTLSSSWQDTYKGSYIGIRTDYSNGTGKWTISKVNIYPAVDYCNGKVSLGEDGGVHGSFINEVI